MHETTTHLTFSDKQAYHSALKVNITDNRVTLDAESLITNKAVTEQMNIIKDNNKE